jgi:type I restriction enzyme S subunit
VTIKKSKYDSLPNYHLKTGDLIMARRGEMGRCGIITENENGWFCGTGSLYLRPKDSKKSMFLLHCITNGATVEYLNHNAKGVTMKNLNKSIISNIPIIACSDEIILRFNLIVEKYDAIRLGIKENLQQIENLFYSVLQRAFSGKLNLDISIELDALLEEIDLQKPENDLYSILSNEEYVNSLLERLNTQDFENQDLYDKAKHAAFQLLKTDEILAQQYDETSKSLKLVIK